LGASQEGYSGGNYGQKTARTRLDSTLVVAGGAVPPVQLLLWRHAVITGLVVDEANEPVVGATVSLVEKSFGFTPPRLVLARTRTAHTDDRGSYRLPGLLPGQYTIAVQDDRGSYPATFFPGTTRPADASMFVLAAGDLRSNTDVQVRSATGRTIEGSLVPFDTTRAWQIQLTRIEREVSTELDTRHATVDGYGRFSFEAVPDGIYILKATAFPAGGNYHMIGRVPAMLYHPGKPGLPPVPEQETLWAEVPVTVGGEGPGRLLLEPRAAPRIRGSVVLHGDLTKPSPERLQSTPVFADPADGSRLNGVSIGSVNPDGSFATAGLPPGSYRLRIPGLTGWTADSISVGDRVVEGPLDVHQADLTDVIVSFTDRPAELSGIVRDAKGSIWAGVAIVVFPTDATLWTEVAGAMARLRETTTNHEGAYRFPGLPAGDYYVATSEPSLVDWRDPARLAVLVSAATRVKVQPRRAVIQNIKTS
jgi:hypothetical protein